MPLRGLQFADAKDAGNLLFSIRAREARLTLSLCRQMTALGFNQQAISGLVQ